MKLLKKKYLVWFNFVVFGFLIWFVWENLESFNLLYELQWWAFLGIAVLNVFSIYLNGCFLRIVVKPFKVSLPEHFWLSAYAGFLNLILPLRGSVGFRAIYMKKRHKLSYSAFISTFFGNYVIIFLISSALALVLMAYFYYTMGYLSYLLLAFFLVLFLGNIWLALTNFRFKKENVITSKINSVTDGWREIIATKGLVRQLCYIVVLNIILNAGMNKFAFLSLGIDVSILQLLFLTTMYVLVVFVNFTPGALGILELVYYFSAEILLVDPTAAVFASLLIRVVNFLVLLVLGLYANRRLFPKSPK